MVTLEVYVSLTVARRRSKALPAVALLITQQLSMESVGFCSFSDAQSSSSKMSAVSEVLQGMEMTTVYGPKS